MTLHTYTPNQYPHQVQSSYTSRFLRYSADKIFFPPPTQPDGTGEKIQSCTGTLSTAFKGCGVKMFFDEFFRDE